MTKEVQNTHFENGRRKALERLGNAAQFVSIDYKENGKSVSKQFPSEAEANKFTKDLDARGVEWMARYSAGWR